MDTAPQPPERSGLGATLARRVAGALAVIVVTSGAFAFVGSLERDPASDPVAVQDPAENETPTPGSTAPADESDPSDGPAAGRTGAAEPTDDAEPTDGPYMSDAPSPGPSEDPEPSDAPDPEPTPTRESDPEPAEEPDAAGLPPSDISIQVLDGYKADGGEAMRGVSEELRGDGYRVVAENQALDYDVTTVLWTAGNEAAARQVAAAIGAGDVRPQPGNLSESVTVHVVVGADRG